MACRKMASEHLAAPAAFQADDVIAIDGSPDRDRGYSLPVSFGDHFTERCTHGRDQRRELVGPDWFHRTQAARIFAASSLLIDADDDFSGIRSRYGAALFICTPPGGGGI